MSPNVIALNSRRITPAMVHALHAAQDDVGAWAESSSEKDANDWLACRAGCRGLSCQQGRKPCRDGCPPLKEMSMYQYDDENETRAAAEWEWIIVWATLAILAVLLVSGVVWLSHHYAQPVLEVLAGIFNN